MLRWGVIATGGIAARFVSDLELVPDATVVAVGSRSWERASAFAAEFAIQRPHASYLDLVSDEDVDVVYVATPHGQHHDAAKLALQAGKPVLCEKAFTVNARQAEDLVSTARQERLFLMEAMWTRFLPHVARIRELIAAGALGDVRAVFADHGQWFAPDPAHRLFDPALGGGALLDLGVYPLSFASMVLGTPTSVRSVTTKTFTGVDAADSIALGYADGRQAAVHCTLEARTPTTAAIVGTEARIEVRGSFYRPTSFDLVRRDGGVEHFSFAHTGHGLRHQAVEVARCLREGLTESPLMPLDETVSIMQTMDEVRAQAGIVLPGDG
jgi:predicted dehydrogenase